MLAHWQGITQMLTIQLEAGLVGNSWCLSAALPVEKNLIYTSFFILQPNFHKNHAHRKDFSRRDAMKLIPSPYEEGMGFLSWGWITIKKHWLQ